MKAALLTTVALALIAILGVSKYYGVKNDLMKTRKNIDDQWLGVVLAVQQRADLIPRLIENLEKTDPKETDVCSALAEARAALARAKSREETIVASDSIDGAVSRLLLVSESHARPKKRKFSPLEDELAEAENRFLLARRKYNEALEHYNVDIQRFPANIVAGIAGFSRNDAYFQTEPGTRELPKVQ